MVCDLGLCFQVQVRITFYIQSVLGHLNSVKPLFFLWLPYFIIARFRSIFGEPYVGILLNISMSLSISRGQPLKGISMTYARWFWLGVVLISVLVWNIIVSALLRRMWGMALTFLIASKCHNWCRQFVLLKTLDLSSQPSGFLQLLWGHGRIIWLHCIYCVLRMRWWQFLLAEVDAMRQADDSHLSFKILSMTTWLWLFGKIGIFWHFNSNVIGLGVLDVQVLAIIDSFVLDVHLNIIQFVKRNFC